MCVCLESPNKVSRLPQASTSAQGQTYSETPRRREAPHTLHQLQAVPGQHNIGQKFCKHQNLERRQLKVGFNHQQGRNGDSIIIIIMKLRISAHFTSDSTKESW